MEHGGHGGERGADEGEGEPVAAAGRRGATTACRRRRPGRRRGEQERHLRAISAVGSHDDARSLSLSLDLSSSCLQGLLLDMLIIINYTVMVDDDDNEHSIS
jgi:hypothetical protein